MDTKLNLLFKNLKILLEFLDVNPNVLRRNNFGTWMILLIFCLKFLPTSLAPRPSLPKMVRAVIGSDMPPPSLPSPPPTTKKNESKLLLALICRHLPKSESKLWLAQSLRRNFRPYPALKNNTKIRFLFGKNSLNSHRLTYYLSAYQK